MRLKLIKKYKSILYVLFTSKNTFFFLKTKKKTM
jgi:hypothetical protein